MAAGSSHRATCGWGGCEVRSRCAALPARPLGTAPPFNPRAANFFQYFHCCDSLCVLGGSQHQSKWQQSKWQQSEWAVRWCTANVCVCVGGVGWGGVGWGGVGWGGVGKKGGGGGGDDYTRGTRLTGWLQSSTRVGQAAAPQFEPGQRPAGCGPTPWRRCVGRVGGRAARKHGCTWLRCRPGAVVGNQHEQVGEQASKRSAFARTCKSVVCNPALPCIPLLTRWRARCSPAAVLMPRPLYGPTQLQARGRVRFQRN